MAAETNPQIDEVIDLDPILAKAREHNGWSNEDTAYAHQWYLRHLQLCRDHPEVRLSAISRKADELWHQHILDTKRYAADCEKLFGKLVHHQPIYGEPSEDDQALHKQTLALYQKEFGETPYDPEMMSAIPM